MHVRQDLIVAASFMLAVAIAGTAGAQTGAPAAAAATPAPSCEKPGDPPAGRTTEMGRNAAETKRNEWFKNMRSYVECLKAFVGDEQAAAAPHIRAANAAAEELNKSIKIFNEQLEATRQ